MQLTRKAEYAIRAMADIAAHYDAQPVMSKAIAARQSIPASFIIHIIPELRAAGLIHTSRGNGGGVYLAQHPSQISVRRIIEAIEGPIALNLCLLDKISCKSRATCRIHTMWQQAQSQMLAVLESTTLAELADAKRAYTNDTSAGGTDRIGNEIEIEV